MKSATHWPGDWLPYHLIQRLGLIDLIWGPWYRSETEATTKQILLTRLAQYCGLLKGP